MNELYTTVVITIDGEEQISLRDFGHITDDEFDDKEAITNAIHGIIADLRNTSETNTKWTEWGEIDSYCAKHMRHNGLNYEMIQAIWLDTTEEDKKNGLHEYVVVRGECNLAEDDIAEDAINSISLYSYTIPFLIEEYGKAANDIIAECYLEEELARDGYIIGEFHTFKEAKKFIDEQIKNDQTNISSL